MTDLEQKISAAFAQATHLDSLDPDENFLNLGVSSLSVLEALIMLSYDGILLSTDMVIEAGTIRRLAQMCEENAGNEGNTEADAVYAMSPAMEQLYRRQVINLKNDNDATRYDQIFVITLKDFTAAEVKNAILEFARLHPSMYAGIKTIEGRPVLVKLHELPDIPIKALDKKPSVYFLEKEISTLDMENQCPFRIKLYYETSDEKTVYMLYQASHIVCDGYSVYMFCQTIFNILSGRPVHGERKTIYDYLKTLEETPVEENEKRYFDELLKYAAWELPVKYDDVKAYKCHSEYTFEAKKDAIDDCCRASGISFSDLLIATIGEALCNEYNLDSVVGATINAGRYEPEDFNIWGCMYEHIPVVCKRAQDSAKTISIQIKKNSSMARHKKEAAIRDNYLFAFNDISLLNSVSEDDVEHYPLSREMSPVNNRECDPPMYFSLDVTNDKKYRLSGGIDRGLMTRPEFKELIEKISSLINAELETIRRDL